MMRESWRITIILPLSQERGKSHYPIIKMVSWTHHLMSQESIGYTGYHKTSIPSPAHASQLFGQIFLGDLGKPRAILWQFAVMGIRISSGKHTKNCGKSPFSMSKFTISTRPFSIAILT